MNVNYEDLEPIIGAALKSAKTANERIDNLPLPMVFKGSLGTGGTISTLPTASSENEGFVYIVITDGTYAGTSAKAGDTFVSDGSSWVLVPSADEPSVIDDSVTSTALTWSSSKINDECKLKSFTYTGNGSRTNNTITFPTKPSIILRISGIDWSIPYVYSTEMPFTMDSVYEGVTLLGDDGHSSDVCSLVKISDTELKISTLNNDEGFALNRNGDTYTVYYI